MQLTIALVQMDIQPGDPEANLTKMDGFARRAAAAGAGLVVFPEDAVTGPLDGQIAFTHRAPEFLSRCAAMAARHEVDLVPGSWSVPDAGGLYNTAYYFNADGTLAGHYSKANLWATEEATITPGPGPAVVPTRHGMVGLTICWDLAHPGMYQAMAGMGAELVVSPTYWSLPRGAATGSLEKKEARDLIDTLCLARAFEADVVLAYCNAAGLVGSGDKEDDKADDTAGDTAAGVLSGRSQLVHPHQKVLARAKGNGEQMLVETFEHVRAGVGAGVPA